MAGVSFTEAVCPPAGDFSFTEEVLFVEGEQPKEPGPNILEPPPAAIPPEGYSYPQSPTWQLSWNNQYRSGWVYSYDYNVQEQIRIDKDRMQTISTPPGIAPKVENGRFIGQPIPGMVKMIPGVPFVFNIDGNPLRSYTIGCLHTLVSLRRFPDWRTILNLSVRLAKLTWGCKAHGTTPIIPRICTLEGLQRNDRSKKLPERSNIPRDGSTVNLASTSRSGSYSLANTVAKGEGQGVVLPASQANTEPARKQIATVLRILHQLYRLIMPKSISKFEMEMADFHSEYNNVVSLGGLEPGPTSCQLNVSLLGKSLKELLGSQGFWHPDNLDDITRYTLFVLLLNISPSRSIFSLNS